MKVFVIGDIHFKDSMGYAQYFEDGRTKEKEEIKDFIVKSSLDADVIVFGGDSMNARNNSSKVTREFVEFLERFNDKKVYVIAGNHEKTGDGKTALDFLKELKDKPNWKIVTNTVEKVDGMVFCPYFMRSELGVNTNEEGLEKVMNMLPDGDILFVHHAISDTKVTSGLQTNIFNEIVFPRDVLNKKYKKVFGAHIHKAGTYGNTIVTGSVFNQEVGEVGKSVWSLDTATWEVKEIPLPGRRILKLEDPSIEDLMDIELSSIVKVIITKKRSVEDMNALKDFLKKFDAHVLIEQYPNERTKAVYDKNILEFSVPELLGLYAEQKKVSLSKLLSAFELIK